MPEFRITNTNVYLCVWYLGGTDDCNGFAPLSGVVDPSEIWEGSCGIGDNSERCFACCTSGQTLTMSTNLDNSIFDETTIFRIGIIARVGCESYTLEIEEDP